MMEDKVEWVKRSWKRFKLMHMRVQTLAEVKLVRYRDGTCRWRVDIFHHRVEETYRTKKEAMDRAITQMVIDRLEA